MENNMQAFLSHFDQSKSRMLLSGGAIFTYLATGKETGGRFTMFEARGIPGMEPPRHVHEYQDESFYILEGQLLFIIGKKEFLAGPGDFVFLPRNIPHQFQVRSSEFRLISSIFPAGIEDYFEPLSIPYSSTEIPPVNTDPPSPEAMEMMQKLNEKFGIRYL